MIQPHLLLVERADLVERDDRGDDGVVVVVVRVGVCHGEP